MVAPADAAARESPVQMMSRAARTGEHEPRPQLDRHDARGTPPLGGVERVSLRASASL